MYEYSYIHGSKVVVSFYVWRYIVVLTSGVMCGIIKAWEMCSLYTIPIMGGNMKVADMIDELRRFPLEAEIHVFSVLTNPRDTAADSVLCHKVREVHSGWFFWREGDTACIEIASLPRGDYIRRSRER